MYLILGNQDYVKIAILSLIGVLFKSNSISVSELLDLANIINETYKDKYKEGDIKKKEDNDSVNMQTLIQFGFDDKKKKNHLILIENLFEKTSKIGKLFIQFEDNFLELCNVNTGNNIVLYTIEGNKERSFKIIDNEVRCISPRQDTVSPEIVLWDLSKLKNNSLLCTPNVGYTPSQSKIFSHSSSKESSLKKNEAKKFKNDKDNKWYTYIPNEIIEFNNFTIKHCQNEECNCELNPTEDRLRRLLSKQMYHGTVTEEDVDNIKNPIRVVKNFWEEKIKRCQSCQHEIFKNTEGSKNLSKSQSCQEFSIPSKKKTWSDNSLS